MVVTGLRSAPTIQRTGEGDSYDLCNICGKKKYLHTYRQRLECENEGY